MTLHVVNRGRYPLNLPGVHEYQCDRHDADRLSTILPEITFDAVVDFCGYAPGDVDSIINILPGRIGQYLFLSTSSVYAVTGMKKETDLLVPAVADESNPIMAYVYNKVLLERELTAANAATGIPYTLLRPTFIYGPFNYAPRESFIIQLILKGIPVPEPVDAKAEFSMVYVEDVARALEVCILNPKAKNDVFNLAGPERVTYAALYSALEGCHGRPFARNPQTVSQVLSDDIPLPFPLETDDLCSGEKMVQTFGFEYTPFSQGMRKTFAAFKPVFT